MSSMTMLAICNEHKYFFILDVGRIRRENNLFLDLMSAIYHQPLKFQEGSLSFYFCSEFHLRHFRRRAFLGGEIRTISADRHPPFNHNDVENILFVCSSFCAHETSSSKITFYFKFLSIRSFWSS